jgi:type I restriction enzyme S subunit
VGKTFYLKENEKLKTESGAKNNSQLPKGWEVKKLGEVCEVQRGLTYSGKDAVDYSDIIVLRATNINLERSALDFSELKYLRNNFIIKDKYKLRKGSLLICFSSGSKNHLGKVALVDNNYNYAFGGFIGQINPKREVDSKYLFYSLISEQYKQYISELTDGVNINNLKIKDLQNFQIPTPSLPEQKRIIAILDRTFKAIDQAKTNTEQNLKNAKELFESYLNRIFEEKGDDWEEKTLKEISEDFGRGKSKHRPRNDKNLYDGDYPFIQTGDVRNCEHYITDYSQTYNDTGLAQSKLWPTGTICITIAANIAETGILSFDACFPDSVIGIVVNTKITNVDFVEYLLQSFKVNIQSLGKGSAQENINMGTFEEKLFPFPSIQEQRQIVQQLDNLSAGTKKVELILQQKLDSLKELKTSILQKAFRGEL